MIDQVKRRGKFSSKFGELLGGYRSAGLACRNLVLNSPGSGHLCDTAELAFTHCKGPSFLAHCLAKQHEV